MRKYFLIFGLGLACLLTSSVFANGSRAYIPQRPASYAIPGWVIGADVGWGYLDTPTDNLFFDGLRPLIVSQSHDLGDIVWGVHAGHTFDITSNMLFGIEAGYKDLGRSKYMSTYLIKEVNRKLTRKVNQQAIDTLLTGNYFIWQGFDLFAKAGVAYVGSTIKQTCSDDNGQTRLDDFNTKKSIWRLRPEVIFGLGYMFNNFDFHVLYDYIYGVSETKWGTEYYESRIGAKWNISNYKNGVFNPPKPRTYGANLVMGGISYTF